MPVALLCTQANLDAELGHTLLWRGGFERVVASRLEEARLMAVAARPDIIVVDRELPRADKLVQAFRDDPATRKISLVVLARGDFDPAEVELLEAGANAILRIPAGPEWDERLKRLIDVPVRKDTRFPVHFEVDAFSPGVAEPMHAQALNLSISGMLLETSHAVSVGDALEVRFKLPGSNDLLKAAARVVRQAGPTLFGIEFGQVAPTVPEHIRAFVEGGTPA